LSIIICVIFSVIICLLIFVKDNNKEKDDFKLDKEIIKKLLDDSYKYYLIKEGLVKVGEYQIDSNDRIYYNVEEEWLKSFNDVRKIIDNTFLKVRVNNMSNELTEEKVLIKEDDIIYIYVPEEKCEINYVIDKEKIKYRRLNNKQALLDLGIIEIYMYKEENGWRFSSNPYNCEFNI